MIQRHVACAGCGRDLPAAFENGNEFLSCPTCLNQLRVFSFPALHRDGSAKTAQPALELGQASCFYHSHKQAVVVCDSCGRFLCALCDIPMGESHRCPACLEAGKRKQKLESIENRRVLYDGLALTLAIVPLLLWPFTLLTAPTAIFLVIKHWRTRLSILPRTKVRFVLAFLIAFAQVCGWIALFYFLIARARKTA